MNKLINKQSYSFDYPSRYTGIPYYFDTIKHREVAGICKQIDFNTPYVSHIVESEDTLDSLALSYYNNPTYWWAIAYFNKINDPFIHLKSKYSVLRIPSISSIIFED
jgi:nucleoid-associated protein YgaU